MNVASVIIGICGSSGSGKTSFCQKLVNELRSVNIRCCGFMSPAVFEGIQKTAIKVCWLESDEEQILLTPVTQTSQLTVGRWQIFPEVFEWINQKLTDLNCCQAFFCDEIGPLEVLEGRGWTKALDILDERKCSLNVVTFRPTLREFFSQRYPEMVIFDLESTDDDEKVIRYVKDFFGIG